jgi:hypothetical protein
MSALRLALSNLERGTRSPQIGTQSPAPERGAGSVRLRFMALGGTALGVAILAISSAVTGITLMALDDLAPTSSEAALWTVALGATVGLLLLWLQRLGKSIWGNSAKILDRLPLLRAPLIGGLVVYGFCSLLLRVGREVVPRFAEGTAFDGYPDLAWPGWSVLLSLAALGAAVGVAVHQRYWQPMTPRQRWVWGPLAAVSAALLLLSIVRPELLARSVASVFPAASVDRAGSLPDGVAPTAGPPSTDGTTTPLIEARDAGVPVDDGHAPSTETKAEMGRIASDGVDDAGSIEVASAGAVVDTERPAQAPNAPASLPAPTSLLAPPGSVSAPPSSPSPMFSPPVVTPPPAVTLPSPTPQTSPPPPVSSPIIETPPSIASPPTISSSPTSSKPPARVGDRLEMLKARAIAQSEQPAELTEAVRTLAQLLKIAPDRANDPVVRRILTKAAGAGGDASREAFRVMGEGMGRRGPDLLYELMLDEPALAERAKHTLSRFRVRRHFSPQLSIAYDLRFSTNCGSRYSLLDRANHIGDQRTIDTLSALLGKPEKCGPHGTLPCLPRCMKEAMGFTRAIEQIARRLRAGELEAKAN